MNRFVLGILPIFISFTLVRAEEISTAAVCRYKVTVFIDEVSAESLDAQNLTIADLVQAVNAKWLLQPVLLRYDSAWLKIVFWDRALVAEWRKSQANQKDPVPFWQWDQRQGLGKDVEFRKDLYGRISEELSKRSPDIVVLLAGNIPFSHAFSTEDFFLRPPLSAPLWLPPTGRGAIAIGTGGMESLEKEKAIRLFSLIFLHEQAHLFGFTHTKAENEIMNSVVSEQTKDRFSDHAVEVLRGMFKNSRCH